jgi:hypothetical protein
MPLRGFMICTIYGNCCKRSVAKSLKNWLLKDIIKEKHQRGVDIETVTRKFVSLAPPSAPDVQFQTLYTNIKFYLPR